MSQSPSRTAAVDKLETTALLQQQGQEPVSTDQEGQNTTPSSRNRQPWMRRVVTGALVVLLVGSIAFMHMYYIPHRIQVSLDSDKGQLRLNSLTISSLDDHNIGFSMNATLIIEELSPVTVVMNQAPLDIKLQRDSSAGAKSMPSVIASTNLPRIVIGAKQSTINFTLSDSLFVRDPEMLRLLLLDLGAQMDVPHLVQLSSTPRFQIPGLVGSWTLTFYREANFTVNDPKGAPINTTILDPKVEAGLPIPKKKHDKDYLMVNGNISFFNPFRLSLNLSNIVGLDFSVYFEGEKVMDIQLQGLCLSSRGINRLPFLVNTDPYTMELLNSLIEKVSDGQKVEIEIRDFEWVSVNPKHRWIQRQFLDGLKMRFPIQITDTYSSPLISIISQFNKIFQSLF